MLLLHCVIINSKLNRSSCFVQTIDSGLSRGIIQGRIFVLAQLS